MKMEEQLTSLLSQTSFTPSVVNAEPPTDKKYFIIGGMGGSHLSADFLKMVYPDMVLFVHKDYGLPRLPEEIMSRALFIAVSHSGNTAETLSFFNEASSKGLNVAAVSTGGELEKLSLKKGAPFVKIPDKGFQPRVAVIHSLIALLALIRSQEIQKLVRVPADNGNLEKEAIAVGKSVSEKVGDRIPVFYSSALNFAAAYYFKAIANETGKTPAFCNFFPELNHNEMAGFLSNEKTKNFSFIFLEDGGDGEEISMRTRETSVILQKAGGTIIGLPIGGYLGFEKVLFCIIAANWMGYSLSLSLKTDADDMTAIEDFKKDIALLKSPME